MRHPIRHPLLGRLSALALAAACHQAGAQAPASAARDIVILTNDRQVSCKIESQQGDAVTISYSVPGTFAITTRTVPWAEIKAVEFAPDPALDAVLSAKDAVSGLGQLDQHWPKWKPWAGRPRHRAGDAVAHVATLALQNADASVKQRAIEWCRILEATDWDSARRDRIRASRLKLLTATGQSAEAVKEARDLLASTGPSQTLVLTCTFILGDAAFAELKKLVEDNPRWEEDDLVRPERARLFNDALDHYLRPSLFFGSEEREAAEGLWRATGVQDFSGDIAAAADGCRDLLKLYPASGAAPLATAFLTKRGLPLEPPAEEPAMPGEAKKADPEEPKKPDESEIQRRKRYGKPDATSAPRPVSPPAP